MIVNPAYVHFKKSEPPAPEDIFRANQVNYQYQGSAKLYSDGFYFKSLQDLKFTGVDCSRRTKIDISGYTSAIGQSTSFKVTIDSGSQTSVTISFPPNGTHSRSVEIPEKHRTKNVSITFSTEYISGTLILTSATLV